MGQAVRDNDPVIDENMIEQGLENLKIVADGFAPLLGYNQQLLSSLTTGVNNNSHDINNSIS